MPGLPKIGTCHFEGKAVHVNHATELGDLAGDGVSAWWEVCPCQRHSLPTEGVSAHDGIGVSTSSCDCLPVHINIAKAFWNALVLHGWEQEHQRLN